MACVWISAIVLVLVLGLVDCVELSDSASLVPQLESGFAANAVTCGITSDDGWNLGPCLAQFPEAWQASQNGAGNTPCPLHCGLVMLWPQVTSCQSLSVWSTQMGDV